MENCKFVTMLNKLRKSSMEAIDNLEELSDFKKYMHVTREVENILKDILSKVNSDHKKTLVLLCGNAGDGKSHLLSWFKNSDDEQLLKDWDVKNDATESTSPEKTAIDSLNDFLTPFNDENIQLEGKNSILAINLGVLNNFIESKYGKKFLQLKDYIEKNCILTSQVNNNNPIEHEHFKHVSFSDDHMYSLTENGTHSQYIEEILNKIFDKIEENIFYKTYQKECNSCTLSEKCPVKKNYEYLMYEKRRKFIENLLIKIMIQDKVILTTREILNFIYDIVVAQNFNKADFHKITDASKYLKEFIEQLTPSLIFESKHSLNLIQKHDPLLDRTEEADEEAILYYVDSDVSKKIISEFKEVSYGEIICKDDYIKLENENNNIKSQLFKLLLRVHAIENNNIDDEVYQDYLKDLYFYNIGKKEKLKNLDQIIKSCIDNYCGKDSDYFCFDDRYKDLGIILYDKIEIEPNWDNFPDRREGEIQQFITSIVFLYNKRNFSDKIVTLDINYSLYNMLYKLSKGYLPNANDKIKHANFTEFIHNILQLGTLKEDVLIAFNNGKKVKISNDKIFGYQFEVIQ